MRNCFVGAENTIVDIYTKFRMYICFPSELRGPARTPDLISNGTAASYVRLANMGR